MSKNRFKLERLISKGKPKETLDKTKYRQSSMYWLNHSSIIAFYLINRMTLMGTNIEYLVMWCDFPEERVREILSGKADIKLSELITLSDALCLDVSIRFSESYK